MIMNFITIEFKNVVVDGFICVYGLHFWPIKTQIGGWNYMVVDCIFVQIMQVTVAGILYILKCGCKILRRLCRGVYLVWLIDG